MNYEHKAHAGLVRCGCTLAAILVTTLLGRGIDGLAKPYSVEAAQSGHKPVVLAKR